MIKAKNLTHYYQNEIALNDVNLQINKGEFVALTGESGSGKSTLLSILSTLLKPTSGEVVINSKNLKDIKNIDSFREKNIGFIFQFHYLIEYLNLKQNVLIAKESAKDSEVDKLFSILDIKNIAHKLPNEISGGQRQRVAIARALINRPNIIFADEPTGNLDSKNSQNVFNILKHLNQTNNTTIVVATHDLNLAKLCDKIYEVKDGKLK